MQSCLEWIPVKGITMALVFVVVEMNALDKRHGPDHIIKGKIRRKVQKVNHSLQTFAGLIMRLARSSYGAITINEMRMVLKQVYQCVMIFNSLCQQRLSSQKPKMDKF